MYCRKCGKQILDDSLFCTGCGTPVSNESVQADGEGDVEKSIIPVKDENQESVFYGSMPIPQNTSVESAQTGFTYNTQKRNNKAIYLIAGVVGIAIIAGIILLVVSHVQKNRIKKVEQEMSQAAQQRAELIEEREAVVTPVPILTDEEKDKPYIANGYVCFGNYKQTSDGKKSPIEWIIVKENEDEYMIISKNILDYHCFAKNSEYELETTWKDSEIRHWLNTEFYEEAFSENEKKYILEKTVLNPDNQYCYNSKGQKINSGGGDTVDKVFLLGLSDIESIMKYKKEEYDKDYGVVHYYDEVICEPTEYLKKDYGLSIYWLRTTGSYNLTGISVEKDGAIYMDGVYGQEVELGVRPVIWLTLDKPNENRTQSNEEIKQSSTDDNNTQVSGIRPEVKEAIDSYEDFMDSYCDFMKSYDSSDWTMLTKYSEFLSQYYEVTEKFDAIADMDLNDAESLYYSEVSLRCSEKMLKAAYDMQ